MDDYEAYLESNLTVEWREKYIEYRLLATLLTGLTTDDKYFKNKARRSFALMQMQTYDVPTSPLSTVAHSHRRGERGDAIHSEQSLSNSSPRSSSDCSSYSRLSTQLESSHSSIPSTQHPFSPSLAHTIDKESIFTPNEISFLMKRLLTSSHALGGFSTNLGITRQLSHPPLTSHRSETGPLSIQSLSIPTGSTPDDTPDCSTDDMSSCPHQQPPTDQSQLMSPQASHNALRDERVVQSLHHPSDLTSLGGETMAMSFLPDIYLEGEHPQPYDPVFSEGMHSMSRIQDFYSNQGSLCTPNALGGANKSPLDVDLMLPLSGDSKHRKGCQHQHTTSIQEGQSLRFFPLSPSTIAHMGPGEGHHQRTAPRRTPPRSASFRVTSSLNNAAYSPHTLQQSMTKAHARSTTDVPKSVFHDSLAPAYNVQYDPSEQHYQKPWQSSGRLFQRTIQPVGFHHHHESRPVSSDSLSGLSPVYSSSTNQDKFDPKLPRLLEAQEFEHKTSKHSPLDSDTSSLADDEEGMAPYVSFEPRPLSHPSQRGSTTQGTPPLLIHFPFPEKTPFGLNSNAHDTDDKRRQAVLSELIADLKDTSAVYDVKSSNGDQRTIPTTGGASNRHVTGELIPTDQEHPSARMVPDTLTRRPQSQSSTTSAMTTPMDLTPYTPNGGHYPAEHVPPEHTAIEMASLIPVKTPQKMLPPKGRALFTPRPRSMTAIGLPPTTSAPHAHSDQPWTLTHSVCPLRCEVVPIWSDAIPQTVKFQLPSMRIVAETNAILHSTLDRLRTKISLSKSRIESLRGERVTADLNPIVPEHHLSKAQAHLAGVPHPQKNNVEMYDSHRIAQVLNDPMLQLPMKERVLSLPLPAPSVGPVQPDDSVGLYENKTLPFHRHIGAEHIHAASTANTLLFPRIQTVLQHCVEERTRMLLTLYKQHQRHIDDLHVSIESEKGQMDFRFSRQSLHVADHLHHLQCLSLFSIPDEPFLSATVDHLYPVPPISPGSVDQFLEALPRFTSFLPPNCRKYGIETLFFTALQLQMRKINQFVVALEGYYDYHIRQCCRMIAECDYIDICFINYLFWHYTHLQLAYDRNATSSIDTQVIDVDSSLLWLVFTGKARLLSWHSHWKLRDRILSKAKHTLQEVYRGLHYLDRYQTVNLKGFISILKLHDYYSLSFPTASLVVLPYILSTHMAQSTASTYMEQCLENLFTYVYGYHNTSSSLLSLFPIYTNPGSAISGSSMGGYSDYTGKIYKMKMRDVFNGMVKRFQPDRQVNIAEASKLQSTLRTGIGNAQGSIPSPHNSIDSSISSSPKSAVLSILFSIWYFYRSFAMLFCFRCETSFMRQYQAIQSRSKLGFLYGLAFMLFLVNIFVLVAVHDNSFNSAAFETAIPMFRILFYITTITFVWGWVCYACEQKKINYQLILQLNVNTYLSSYHVFELAVFLLIIFLTIFLVFVMSESYDYQSEQQYFTLYGIIVGCAALLLNPLDIFYRGTRIYLLIRLWRCITAPFSVATIQETFVANFLGSLSRMLYDFAYISCIYTRYPPSMFPLPHPADVDPMTVGLNIHAMHACSHFVLRYFTWVRLLPAFCRMWQCVRSIYVTKTAYPFLGNAVKYFLTCLVYGMSWVVVLDSDYTTDWVFIVWWVLAGVKSIYSMYWDIVMDWQIPYRHTLASSRYELFVDDVNQQGTAHNLYPPHNIPPSHHQQDGGGSTNQTSRAASVQSPNIISVSKHGNITHGYHPFINTRNIHEYLNRHHNIMFLTSIHGYYQYRAYCIALGVYYFLYKYLYYPIAFLCLGVGSCLRHIFTSCCRPDSATVSSSLQHSQSFSQHAPSVCPKTEPTLDHPPSLSNAAILSSSDQKNNISIPTSNPSEAVPSHQQHQVRAQTVNAPSIHMLNKHIFAPTALLPRAITQPYFLIHRSIWIYYLLILYNCIAHSTYIFAAFPYFSRSYITTAVTSEYFIPLLGAAEIIRRGIWAYLRLENEQIKINMKYKAFDLEGEVVVPTKSSSSSSSDHQSSS